MVLARLRARLMPAAACTAVAPYSKAAEQADQSMDLPSLWKSFVAAELKSKGQSHANLTIVKKLVMHRLNEHMYSQCIKGTACHGVGLGQVTARCPTKHKGQLDMAWPAFVAVMWCALGLQ